jgi:predicted Zn-ribbon and HTH transcriptional regulator
MLYHITFMVLQGNSNYNKSLKNHNRIISQLRFFLVKVDKMDEIKCIHCNYVFQPRKKTTERCPKCHKYHSRIARHKEPKGSRKNLDSWKTITIHDFALNELKARRLYDGEPVYHALDRLIDEPSRKKKRLKEIKRSIDYNYQNIRVPKYVKDKLEIFLRVNRSRPDYFIVTVDNLLYSLLTEK